jgi:hypothetical protein
MQSPNYGDHQINHPITAITKCNRSITAITKCNRSITAITLKGTGF